MTDHNTAIVDMVARKLAEARQALAAATESAKEQAHIMHTAGESEYTIATKLGVARTTVRDWLHR